MNENAIKELLKRCFPGNDEFYDRYMLRRGGVDGSVTAEKEGRIIADLQLVAYPMRCFGGTISTSYCFSACVAPEERGQGVMRRLIAEALQRNRDEGAVLSTLIPADAGLFGYYERAADYTAIFHYVRNRMELTAAKRSAAEPSPTGVSAADAYTLHRHAHSGKVVFYYLNERMARRRCCVLHTEEELAFVVDDILTEGGWLYTLSRERNVVALAIGFTNGDELILKELLADTEEARQTLLGLIGAEQHAVKAVVTTPSADAATPAMGMARIVNVLPLLQLYAAAHPEQERHLSVADPLLAANNGYYDLADGTCSCGKEPSLDDYYDEVSIGELADWLFTDEHPCMSLMLD
jgi:predicted acetyltransferase